MNNKKKKILIIILSIFLFISLLTLFINIYMVSSVKNNIISIDDANDIKDIDVIMILGCKVEDNRPSLMLEKRLDKGIEIYNKIHSKILVTGSGEKEDGNLDEITIMSKYLIDHNVDPSDILLDYEGFTTYDSIYRAKHILNTQKMVIITQEYHIYRSLFLANKLGVKAFGIVADDVPQKWVMIKNNIREILSRDKNFFKGIIKPESKYNGKIIEYNNEKGD